jgi:tetratricopeptide (TPR) repeat protein
MLLRTFSLACAFVMALGLSGSRAMASPADPNAMAAAQASAALMRARKLEFLSDAQVTQLLLDERFQEFEDRTHKYERLFASDPVWESSLWKLFSAIDGSNPHLKEKLDKWVRMNPSYISYTARGTYNVNLAYKQRGALYIRDTPPEDLALMEATMREAQRDLEKALERNSKFIPTYMELLQVAQAIGGVDIAQAIERRAAREVPTTYYLRYVYLMNLRPRWGGSYELMTAYEDGLTDAARLNPRIWSLKGQSWAERGYSAWQDDRDLARAVTYYTKALEFGDRMEFFKTRGILHLDLHQYDLALKDFSRYREYGGTDDAEVDRYVQCSKALRDNRPCPANPAAPPTPRP